MNKITFNIAGELLDLIQPVLQQAIDDSGIDRWMLVNRNVHESYQLCQVFGSIVWHDTTRPQLTYCDARVIRDCLPRAGKQVVADINHMFDQDLKGVKQGVQSYPILGYIRQGLGLERAQPLKVLAQRSKELENYWDLDGHRSPK